jgi:predicted MFS family arabinose efflux permease
VTHIPHSDDVASLPSPIAAIKPDIDRMPWRLLILLAAMMFLNYMDRYIIGIFVEPIKKEFGLSDMQIGLLTGFAFSAAYAFAGLPLGRLADRKSRVGILTLSLVAWSAMTASCGLARTFAQLLASRLAVGIGEAGWVPAAYSLVTQLAPPLRRSSAFSILGTASRLGVVGGFAIGGVLESYFGWREALVALGVIGVLLALVTPFLVREPTRSPYATGLRISGKQERLGLLRNPVFVQLAMALALLNLVAFGRTQWLPAYLERSFGLARSQLGAMLAFTQGIGSVLGVLFGGFLADQLSRRNLLWPLRLMIVSIVLALPFSVAAFLAPTSEVAFSLLFVASFIEALASGPSVAMVQSVVAPEQRGTAAAIVLFATAIIGSGMGPLAIGLVSDWLVQTTYAGSLRLAIIFVTGPVAIWSMLHYLRAHQLLAGKYRGLLDPRTEAG